MTSSPPDIPRRNLAIWVTMTVLTLGIMGVIWFVHVASDLRQLREEAYPMAWKDLLLGICTAGIWFLVVIHRYLGYLMEAGQRYDVELEDHRIQSIIVPLFAVIVLPTLIIYVLLFLVFAQKELNYLSGQLEGDPEI